MYIGIAYHAQGLRHWIAFKNVLASYIALNCLIVINFSSGIAHRIVQIKSFWTCQITFGAKSVLILIIENL